MMAGVVKKSPKNNGRPTAFSFYMRPLHESITR